MTLLSLDEEENEVTKRRWCRWRERGGIHGKCMEAASGGVERELFDGFPVD